MRRAARGLARVPGFTAAAVLTLALGIAGTTGMFTLVQGVLLRPLPVRDSDQLIVGWLQNRASGASHWPIVATSVDTIARSSRLLIDVAGVDYNGVSATPSIERGVSDTVNQLGVTGRFFDV